MDIETVLRKLEPLMPGRVARWQRSIDAGSADLALAIKRQAAALAHREFGDIRKHVLLSLPPERKARGAFNLGTIRYGVPRWPCGLRSNELLQNLAIFGRSGAGKTNALFHILLQLVQRGIPFLFLDWKRTGRHLLPRMGKPVQVFTPGRRLARLAFNPFICPPGIEQHVHTGQLVDIIAHAFTLGDGSSSVLHDAINRCKREHETPSLHQVTAAVEQVTTSGRSGGWRISAMRALKSLEAIDGSTAALDEQVRLTRQLLDQSTILELDSLSAGSKKFLIPTLCLWLYSMRLSAPDREKLRFVIIIEEAHHVLHRHLGGGETVLEMLLRQCRELGIGMIIVDQHPQLISPAVLGNTYASICFNLKDPRDIRQAAALSLVPERERACFSHLPVGQAIVKLQDRWTRPFLVEFPCIPVRKGAVTDRRLSELTRPDTRMGSLSTRIEGAEAPRTRIPRLPPGDDLGEDDLALLTDVAHHPTSGVQERYSRLGWSGRRGDHTKVRLVQGGWLEQAMVPLGRTRKRVLRMGTVAKHVGPSAGPWRRESVVHAYWKLMCAGLLEELGFRVMLEARRVGGHVDVLATKRGRTLAIEIETGRSTAVENLTNCLRSRFDRIVVIATESAVAHQLTDRLRMAGVLIPARVSVLNARTTHEELPRLALQVA